MLPSGDSIVWSCKHVWLGNEGSFTKSPKMSYCYRFISRIESKFNQNIITTSSNFVLCLLSHGIKQLSMYTRRMLSHLPAGMQPHLPLQYSTPPHFSRCWTWSSSQKSHQVSSKTEWYSSLFLSQNEIALTFYIPRVTLWQRGQIYTRI